MPARRSWGADYRGFRSGRHHRGFCRARRSRFHRPSSFLVRFGGAWGRGEFCGERTPRLSAARGGPELQHVRPTDGGDLQARLSRSRRQGEASDDTAVWALCGRTGPIGLGRWRCGSHTPRAVRASAGAPSPGITRCGPSRRWR